MRVFFNNIDGILLIIKALSDPTRLLIIDEILNTGDRGVTAADLSRKINKKIPSTLHQLEILKTANIIEDKMVYVDSIGREIKHWFIPKERYKIIIDLSLSSLSKAQTSTYIDRIDAIQSYQRNYNISSPLKMDDIGLIIKNIKQLSKEKIEIISEEEIFDALALEVYNKFRNAEPPSVVAEIFDEINNFTPEVGFRVKEILFKNQRIEEKIDQVGSIHYIFLTM
jgi:DNA-binding transcriptional ArsR family regulator